MAAFLFSFFSSFFGLISTWLTTKVGIGVAFSTVFTAATLVFYEVAKTAVSGVVMSVPYEPFVMGFYACWPANAETCIAAMLGMDVACLVYRFKTFLISNLAQL